MDAIWEDPASGLVLHGLQVDEMEVSVAMELPANLDVKIAGQTGEKIVTVFLGSRPRVGWNLE